MNEKALNKIIEIRHYIERFGVGINLSVITGKLEEAAQYIANEPAQVVNTIESTSPLNRREEVWMRAIESVLAQSKFVSIVDAHEYASCALELFDAKFPATSI